MECERCGDPLDGTEEFQDICDDCAIIEGEEADQQDEQGK